MPDDQIYKFLGFAREAGGEVIDLSAISSSQDLSFYAVYDNKPMSVYDNFTYVNNADTYFNFTASSFNTGSTTLNGYIMTVKDGVTLKGKVTLPSIYNNSDVLIIGDNGFMN